MMDAFVPELEPLRQEDVPICRWKIRKD